jgi:ATP/maltotriose-dependent transcriptional regulator MalT
VRGLEPEPVTLADVLDRRGRTAEAEAAAVKGLELARRGRARLETACALLCLARIGSRGGNIDDAGNPALAEKPAFPA